MSAVALSGLHAPGTSAAAFAAGLVAAASAAAAPAAAASAAEAATSLDEEPAAGGEVPVSGEGVERFSQPSSVRFCGMAM